MDTCYSSFQDGETLQLAAGQWHVTDTHVKGRNPPSANREESWHALIVLSPMANNPYNPITQGCEFYSCQKEFIQKLWIYILYAMVRDLNRLV